MWRMWGDWERFVSPVGLELAIPEPPRDIFEAWAILKGTLTFRKD